jgi:DNA-binding transcriptional regulator YiaG
MDNVIEPSLMEKLLTEIRNRPVLPPREVCRYIRERAGVSQEALAAVVKVSPSAIIKWEQGTRNPSGLRRDRYAEALRKLCGEAQAGMGEVA